MGCYLSVVLRVVLDTSFLPAALRSRRGASFVLLRTVRSGCLTPLATPSLFLECEEVLKRPEQREVSKLSLADVDRVLGVLAFAVHMRWRPQLRDPDDELVLEAAVNGRADALVTYNVRDFRDVAPRFGVRIARPVDLLEDLRSRARRHIL